jgi:hypothetical protein
MFRRFRKYRIEKSPRLLAGIVIFGNAIIIPNTPPVPSRLTTKIDVVVVRLIFEFERMIAPLGNETFEDPYVGDPAVVEKFRPFPLLSFHCATVLPAKTILVSSAPSNQINDPGIASGLNGGGPKVLNNRNRLFGEYIYTLCAKSESAGFRGVVVELKR